MAYFKNLNEHSENLMVYNKEIVEYNGMDYNDYLIEQAIDKLTDEEWENL